MELPTPRSDPTLSPAAIQEWERHLEQVMRGVAHALNNRAASVSAVLELSFDPGEDGAPTRALLGAEVQRLRDLAEVVRTVGSPRGAVEALSPADAAAAARVVVSLHADLRERSITIDGAGASPIRVPRWLFVRALVALAADASAGGPSNAVAIRIRDDQDWVIVSALPSATLPAQKPSDYLREAAAALGGEVLRETLGFRLPSLAGLRRREGR